MNARALLTDYGIDLDDIRWYLAHQLALRAGELLEKDRSELVRWIWSGELEAELYDNAERFLAELQDSLDRRLTDEPRVREIFAEAAALKTDRPDRR